MIKQIICLSCGSKIGERDEYDIWPEIKSDVFIQKGMIYFICKCKKYTQVEKNSSAFILHKPGSKRIT